MTTNKTQGLEMDPVNGKIYWAQTFGDRIIRSDLNGGNVETYSSRPSIS